METNNNINSYLSSTATTGTVLQQVQVNGEANWIVISDGISATVRQKTGIHPELFFKYMKKKFGTLEKMRLNARLKRLTKAFDVAVENGQDALGRKFLNECVRESRESTMYAKGIKYFIEREDVSRHKNKIRDGHIADTLIKDFTRNIPADVIEKKNKVKDCFDDFVVYHYWDEKVEEKRTKKQKLSEDEKQKMRDPILFGIIKETDRLYFIAEWEDEHCDLSFDEIVDVLGKDEEDITISRIPVLK